MPKISELYPKATCEHCGWIGNAMDLQCEEMGSSTEELCPECSSPDTWWLTIEEYDTLVNGDTIDEW